ncbi:MAG: hypothetical protein COA69_10490 [Robiginitomaculum sp.]|nr:MAG: hypothetical protein COA69_10490 [Robiginitomaculum sp.]
MTNARKKVAILASGNILPGHPEQREDVFELDEEIGKLRPAFADHGMDLSVINWRDAPLCAVEYDAMLPLFVWDYFEENEAEFLTAMAQVEKNTKLFNGFDILKWNINKTYLDELSGLGAATIPTITIDKVSQTRVLRAMEELDTTKIVIKPVIGGGAWRQVLYEAGTPFPSADDLPPQGALIQPFLPSVEEEGEYSFLYFGGSFSHALLKRPKAGDYRVQSIYGGQEEAYTPTKEERAQAHAVLDVLDFTPLYARVDFLRGQNNRLWLIELELIEPYLYLPFAEGERGDNKGAQKLAKALARKLAPKLA